MSNKITPPTTKKNPITKKSVTTPKTATNPATNPNFTSSMDATADTDPFFAEIIPPAAPKPKPKPKRDMSRFVLQPDLIHVHNVKPTK